MSEPCRWPEGACACYSAKVDKPDPQGRVWMHCEDGLSMSKASMTRFIMFCLTNSVEIGSIHPFNYRYKNSQVSAAIRIHPDLFQAFETETRGKLRRPPRISLNSSSPDTSE